MSQYTIDADARSDMDEIWLFIARDNLDADDRVINLFLEKFRMLGRQPLIGESCEELLPNLRSFPVGNYVIFYFAAKNSIQIVRVLHGARDVGPMFRDSNS